MSVARDQILQRIRAGLHDVPAQERPDDVEVQRAYRHTADRSPGAALDLFADRLIDYRAAVRRIHEPQLGEAIAESLLVRDVHRLAIPTDLPASWIPSTVEAVPDTGLSAHELDAVDGVLTGCALGIAQTGTIVLDGGAMQGRRALSLLPDFHLCIVFAHQVVALVPEAIRALHDAARSGRAITLISGPSATSDIELSRVEGVHGPRTLEVLIVEEG